MKKIIILSFLIIQTCYSQSDFKVDFDYAAFRYNDSLSYVEIYYSFYQTQFRQVNSDGSLPEINGELNIRIINSADQNTLFDKSYQFSTIIDTSSSGGHKGFIGALDYLLPLGSYICSLTGRDLNAPENADSIVFNITVKQPAEDRFSISDIELASSIKEAETDSGMFYKNTYEVLPNPGNIYGGLMPVVYFYTEIYNITINQGSEKLKVENILYKGSDQVFFKRSKLIPRNNNSVVEAGTINISKAPSGAYTLVVAVTDSLKNLSIYSSKRLYIYNPGVPDSQTYSGDDIATLSSEFAIMSEEELNETFAISTYVATDFERDQWKKLTSEESKRTFLLTFWNARDKNTTTPQNEFKREYFDRVKTANEKYSNIQRKGWKSDRGRVLILYGEPSDIERYPNQVDTKPYEIWQYEELEGGVIFVFADLTGFNDYLLIHSTMRGELRDDLWMRKVGT